MKYYKKVSGEIYGFEDDGSQDHLIEDDMVALTTEESDAINNPPPASFGVSGGTLVIEKLYSRVMGSLSSKYTQQEINTFPEKVAAAKAYASGSPETDDIYYLAKIDGVVNGAVPLNDAEIQAEVDGINAAGLLIVADRAQKILDARKAFNFWTAKIEQVRNTHLAMLVEGEDNQPVVDALAAIYGAIE